MTAIANDDAYGEVFATQLRGTICDDDAFLAISVSGESDNLVRAAKLAHDVGAVTAAFVGDSRSTLAALVDHFVPAPSDSYGADRTSSCNECHRRGGAPQDPY